MKVREISNTAEIDDLERAIVASADSTVDALRTLLARTTESSSGRYPLSARPLNLIEQVNQTFTYLASCDALRYLLAHHPDRAFVIHLGTAAGPDIESTDHSIVAEVFAATRRGASATANAPSPGNLLRPAQREHVPDSPRLGRDIRGGNARSLRIF